MKEEILNEIIGTLGLMEVKVRQYKWFSDLSLEQKTYLTKLSEEIIAKQEVLAQVLQTQEQFLISTLTEFLEYSWIKEYPYTKKISSRELILDLIVDLKEISKRLKESFEYFEDDGLLEQLKELDIYFLTQKTQVELLLK